MALKIITKKRFENSLQKVSKYLNDGWGKREAEVFVSMVIDRLNLLSENPNIGVSTAIKNTKSTLAGKGFQNKIYYRVEKGKLIVIDMKDTRTNPKTNPFNKTK